MSDAIKIQINSAEALQRLLGEDTELQIQIRDRVANDFITNHIKPLLTDEKYAAFKCEIETKIQAAKDKIVADLIGSGIGIMQLNNKERIELKPAIKTAIKQMVDETIKEIIETHLIAMYDEMVKMVDETVKEIIETHLTAMYDEMIKKVSKLFDENSVKLQEYIAKVVKIAVATQVAMATKEMVAHMSELSAHYQEALKERTMDERKIELQL